MGGNLLRDTTKTFYHDVNDLRKTLRPPSRLEENWMIQEMCLRLKKERKEKYVCFCLNFSPRVLKTNVIGCMETTEQLCVAASVNDDRTFQRIHTQRGFRLRIP